MKRLVIPSLCLVLAVVAFGCFAQAQDAQTALQNKATAQQITDDAIQLMRSDIRSQKKQLIAANLPLTDAEATKFWLVYDKYTNDTVKLNDTRYALVKQYADSYNTMTDDQATTFIKEWLTADGSVTQLRLKWIPEFQKVIGAKKTAMFFQMDRRIGLMVDLQLASQVPLVKP